MTIELLGKGSIAQWFSAPEAEKSQKIALGKNKKRWLANWQKERRSVVIKLVCSDKSRRKIGQTLLKRILKNDQILLQLILLSVVIGRLFKRVLLPFNHGLI